MIDLVAAVQSIFHAAGPEAGLVPSTMPKAPAAPPPAPVIVQHAAVAETELKLTQEVEQNIERDEGDRLTAYPDPGSGGDPWTIGYGHTGPDVYEGLTITQDQAVAKLEKDLVRFENAVEDDILGRPTNANQFSAMVSLAFNIGTGAFAGSSVLRFHNEGQYQRAADAFLLWNKAGGRVMAGLVRRRQEERAFYLEAPQ